MKAAGRVTLPESFRRRLAGNQTPAEFVSKVEWFQHLAGQRYLSHPESGEDVAWYGWCTVVGSLWRSRADARAGADAKPAMDQVRTLARQMRPALLAGDWKTARLQACAAENMLLRLRVALLTPFAVAHAKVQASKGFHERLRFQRAIRELRARWSRNHGRELTHAEALKWSELNGFADVDPRLCTKWLHEILGRRRTGRPSKTARSTR